MVPAQKGECQVLPQEWDNPSQGMDPIGEPTNALSRETPASHALSRNNFNGHKSGVWARSLNFYTIQKYTLNKITKIEYFSC